MSAYAGMILKSMDSKPRPNHSKHLEILRRMTPGERLEKAFELSAFTKELFMIGLRQRFPNVSEQNFTESLWQG